MFCQNCGKEIPDDANMCPYCGTKFAVNDQQSVPLQGDSPKEGKKKNKKIGCLIPIIVVVALIAIVFVIAVSSGSNTTVTSDTTATSDETENNQSQQSEENENTYKIGDTVTVHTDRGDYSLKFTGVRETSDRNEFADDAPQRVVILEYEYKNISFDSDVVVSYLYFRAYDKDGNSLSIYPDTSVKQSSNISQGKTHTASVAYGLNSNDNVVIVDFYDITMESLQKAECTFNLTW